MYTQRDQFTHEQLPFEDRDVISQKADSRDVNHISSAMSKAQLKGPLPKTALSVGDLVYLYSYRDKTKARPRYIVVGKNDDWCHRKKFVGSQLRSSSYKVKLSECYVKPVLLQSHIRHTFTPTMRKIQSKLFKVKT